MRLRICIVERMSTAWKISFGLRWFGGGPVREFPCAGGKNRKVTSAIPFWLFLFCFHIPFMVYLTQTVFALTPIHVVDRFDFFWERLNPEKRNQFKIM